MYVCHNICTYAFSAAASRLPAYKVVIDDMIMNKWWSDDDSDDVSLKEVINMYGDDDDDGEVMIKKAIRFSRMPRLLFQMMICWRVRCHNA